MFGMSVFLYSPRDTKGTKNPKKEKAGKMNTQTETKQTVEVAEKSAETENPMQERHLGKITESVEETAETVFTEQKREVREEAGPTFVP
jgi:hypothetical protein